jgi:hypothetical protein
VIVGGLSLLLDRATVREPMKTADSKSGATFERLVIDGARYVLKVVDGRSDWLSIGCRDEAARAICLWENGVYQRMPASIDHSVVEAARLDPPSPWPAALLMHDVSDSLVPEDDAVGMHVHDAFVGAMADLAVTFHGHPPDTTYMPFAVNYAFLSPGEATRQAVAGTTGGPQPFIVPGWEQIRSEAPEIYNAVRDLLEEPQPLADALLETPTTFLHGDWKMGNLGYRGDGRVVLLDWDRPSIGAVAVDLAWYLAVNSDRLPESKDATLSRFRDALEARQLGTAEWWNRQSTLALLGAFLQLGWSKAGQDEELAWWLPVVHRARRLLAAW